MILERVLRTILVGFIFSLFLPVAVCYAEKIKVVTTFSILGDIVKQIGGEHIVVTSLVGPDGDTHVYRPTPADARDVSEAEILVVNGLDFEGWLDRLVEASDFKGTRLVATRGIEAIPYKEDEHDDHGKREHDDHGKSEHDDHGKREHDDHAGHNHGAFDPHAWQSLENAVIYVNNITEALAQFSPENASDFYQNRAAYIAEINKLNKELQAMIDILPKNRRTVVTSHDAFQYLGRDYGLTFMAPQGLSTDSEASAQNVARLIEQVRVNQIKAVFVENITDPRLIKQIANETGATIGGTLYPGALSGPNGPASNYLMMIRHNVEMLSRALGDQ